MNEIMALVGDLLVEGTQAVIGLMEAIGDGEAAGFSRGFLGRFFLAGYVTLECLNLTPP